MGSNSGGPPPADLMAGAAELGDVLLAGIEASPVATVLSDPNRPDEPIIYANPAFLRMTGYGRSEVLGRNCRFLQGGDTDQSTVDEIRRALRARSEVATEILNYRKDGTPFWNALSISPVFGRSGSLAYHFASQLDVSRRRDAEEALRRGPGARPAGPGSTHDFNNLLQVITGHLHGLKRQAAVSGDARLIRSAGAASEAADRAVELARRLLAPEPQPRSRAPGPPEAGSTGRGAAKRILVVDDRIELAELARTMLEEAGYTVDIARDALDALTRLDGGFDLLFSDLVMPGGLDGAALAREARRRQPGLRVLLTTGHAEAGRVDAPEFGTIVKPYRRSELAEAVRAALCGSPDGG